MTLCVIIPGNKKMYKCAIFSVITCFHVSQATIFSRTEKILWPMWKKSEITH